MTWSPCALCPRRCGAERTANRRGYCGAGTTVELFRYGPHHGEEPPISGTRGSGTVFFSRCTMRCLYCQNFPWSQGGVGDEYGVGDLGRIFLELAESGCHNWNLVSPTPWLPAIIDGLALARAGGHSLPVVYNTSGYERTETLRELDGRVDIYLTDLRYARDESAVEGSDARGYVEVARAALRTMWEQVGPLATDADLVARRGTICRLLILPGKADEAVANLEWAAATIGTELAVSVMAQYTPAHKAPGNGEWGRGITRREYDQVVEAVSDFGFDRGWVQAYGEPTPEGLLGCNMRPGGA